MSAYTKAHSCTQTDTQKHKNTHTHTLSLSLSYHRLVGVGKVQFFWEESELKEEGRESVVC